MSEYVFYDGSCGFCHWSVRRAVELDRNGHFLFAPIGGETFRSLVDSGTSLPDSIVVRTERGELLTRSAAVLQILRRSGGWGAVAAAVLGLVPATLRDWGYDRFAAVRRRLFERPSDVCPILPPDLRRRFLP